MRLLVDTCISPLVVKALRAAGYEVEWVGDWQGSPADEEVLKHAYVEGQVIVTLDKDFGTLAVALDRPHRGIVRIAAGLSRIMPPSSWQCWTSTAPH